MPAFNFNEQQLHCGRDQKYGWKIFDDETDGPVAILVADVVRAKLALTEGQTTPTLDISSKVGEVLTGGSKIVIEDLGSVGNPNPASDRPASGYVFFARADTAAIPAGWTATEQTKRYWLEFLHIVAASGQVNPFGRGRLLLHRSPGGSVSA
jgi:hypothetical protein